MRRLSMRALLVVSIFTAACNKPATLQAPAPGEVTIKIECLSDGGVSVVLTPWQVRLPNPAASFTFTNLSSAVDIDITSQGPFPFNGQPHHANHGNHVVAKPVPNTPPRTYKYNVNATCPGGRNIIIDPDMIIPN
ncbi:MAG TPA: hypothetical protein VM053_12535 [Gemmatimonadaceae bacterium]|nr:hypothetical protein [Gemmatimonadaceae bacterium]